MPSTAISSVSIARALVLPLRTGDSYFTGQAFVKLHEKAGTLLESIKVTVRAFGVPVPSTKVENQSQRAVPVGGPAMPLLRMRSPYFTRPGSLWTLLTSSAPSLYSITSMDADGRMHSAKDATAIPSMLTVKLTASVWLVLADVEITPAVLAYEVLKASRHCVSSTGEQGRHSVRNLKTLPHERQKQRERDAKDPLMESFFRPELGPRRSS